mmetsp:Transcript_30274/g.74405  ORF Transcript_30274/g.74405 Transcript_30274/m.74405 type:complete len:207 (-) Transcript_30274:59-679(-)
MSVARLSHMSGSFPALVLCSSMASFPARNRSQNSASDRAALVATAGSLLSRSSVTVGARWLESTTNACLAGVPGPPGVSMEEPGESRCMLPKFMLSMVAPMKFVRSVEYSLMVLTGMTARSRCERDEDARSKPFISGIDVWSQVAFRNKGPFREPGFIRKLGGLITGSGHSSELSDRRQPAMVLGPRRNKVAMQVHPGSVERPRRQ